MALQWRGPAGKNDGSGMDLDPTFLMLSLITTGIGFVSFVYGRKAARWLRLAIGIVFMVYPYFTGGVMTLAGVGLPSASGCIS